MQAQLGQKLSKSTTLILKKWQAFLRLKQLITKLPAGVTKQTGATIIKQTMEALGVSMTALLQEVV